MNRLRPYEPGDALQVSVQAAQGGEDLGVYDQALGPAMTLERDGRVVGVAGVAEIWPGRMQAWGLFSDLSLREWALARSACRRVLDAVPGRVEASACFPAAERFLAGLGFEKEGVMRRYYKGRDYALYARVIS